MYVEGIKTVAGFLVCRSDDIAGKFLCGAQPGLGCLGLKIVSCLYRMVRDAHAVTVAYSEVS